jgi:hypothetical protein
MIDTTPEAVFEINAGHYEWCTLVVFRHPAMPQHYAVFSGSGCSCNIFHWPTEEEIRAAEPVRRLEVRRRVAGFISQYPYHIDGGAALRHMEKFETTMNDEEGK